MVPETAVALFEARGWSRRDLPAGMDADDPRAPEALDECLAEEARLAAEPTPETEPEPAVPAKPSKSATPATDKKE